MFFGALLVVQLFLTVNSQGSGSCETPDKQTGYCIPVKTCRTMNEYLAKVPKPVPPEIRQKLRRYQCGLSGGMPRICCPANPIKYDEPVEDTAEQRFEFPDVSNHRNLNLIPKDCGHLDTVMKIVNGNLTSLFEFPWMALLSYSTPSGPDFRCGGTILNKNYILTAAHCVHGLEKLKEKIKLIGVRVGEHNTRTNKDCEEDEDEVVCAPPVQDLGIEEVIPHNNYNGVTHYNDIALIRVSPIDLTQENSRPVCLPFGDTGNFNHTNRKAVVTGWGFTENGNPSNVLLKAELPVTVLKKCSEQYKKIYKLVQTQLCAGGDKISDSCGGDSGGPLQSLETLHGEPRYIQQGIVSFGPAECGTVSLPGVYTRVAFYMDWILDNLNP